MNQLLIKSRSHWSRIVLISSLALDLVFLSMETQITFREVPQDFPKAFFDGTNTYGTFYLKYRVLFIRKGLVSVIQSIMEWHQLR